MLWLEDEDNVDWEWHTVLHDGASGWRAEATQELLEELEIDAIPGSGSCRWPGNSPDLNPTENLGSILKDKVAEQLDNLKENRYSEASLKKIVRKTLARMAKNTDLLERLIDSFDDRMHEVIEKNGGKIDY